MKRKFALSAAAYFVVTMFVAVIWHLVLFHDEYVAMGAFQRRRADHGLRHVRCAAAGDRIRVLLPTLLSPSRRRSASAATYKSGDTLNKSVNPGTPYLSHDKIMLGNPAAVAEARDLLERAVGLDAEFATAHALIGMSHYFDIHFGFTSDPDRSAQRLSASTDRALELEPNSPLACCDRALLHLFREDLDAAVEYGRRAVALSPNDAFLKLALGRILIHAGILNEAESEVRAAMRINPFYPTYYFGVLANALEMQGKDEEAIELVQAAVQRDANYFSGHPRLASLLGIAGKTEAARAHAEQALRISPRIDRALLKGFYPTNNPEALARFLGGLDAAGIRID